MNVSLRLLVVEDNPDLRMITVELLQELGHRAVAFDSAGPALAALTKDRFDMLFTDVRLPGMSGVELAREVLKLRDMPIVISSGYGDEFSVKTLGRELGREIFLLPKPYTVEAMATVLADAMRTAPDATG